MSVPQATRGAPVPDAAGLELIAGEINAAIPDAVISTYHQHGQACLVVEPAHIRGVLAWLRDTPGQEYGFLSSVHGADYYTDPAPLAGRRFGVHYELLNRNRVERLRVRAAVPFTSDEELPHIDSVTDMFPTAEFQEREVYDFFGIVFDGHPDMRRILMPEGYEGWPQRRDFPVGGDPVIFTNTERETPGWTR